MKALFPGSRHVVQRFRFLINSKDLVPFSQSQPEIAVGSSVKSSRPIQWRLGVDLGTIGRGFSLPVATPGLDSAACKVDETNPVIPDVADEKRFSRIIEDDGMRTIHRSLDGGSSIPGETRLPRACDRRNGVRPRIEFPYEMVLHLHPVEVPVGMISQLVRFEELCRLGITPVSGIACLARPREGLDLPRFPRNSADHMIDRITENNVSIRCHDHPERLVELGCDRLSSVPLVTSFSIAGHGFDLGRSKEIRRQEQEDSQGTKKGIRRKTHGVNSRKRIPVWPSKNQE